MSFFTRCLIKIFVLITSITFDNIFAFINFFKRKRVCPPITNPILLMSCHQLIDAMQTKKVTCRKILESYISRQQQVQPFINAICFDRYAQARKDADKVDRLIAETKTDTLSLWNERCLLGIPISIKESFKVKNCPNSTGLVSRRNYLSDSDAESVSRFKKAGAIIVCITNTSELCMWWESSNKLYGRTNNPYDSRRIVGGSSGGEGALVASAGSLIGLGSDIGGSIRMPAHFNGVFGHKCSSNLVPLDGQFPEATGKELEFLVCGPLTRFGADLRIFMNVLAGERNSEKFQLNKKIENIKDIHFFYIEDLMGMEFTRVTTDILTSMRCIKSTLISQGCKLTEIRPSHNLSEFRRSFSLWNAAMISSGAEKNFKDFLSGDKPGSFRKFRELFLWFLGLSNFTFPAIALAFFEDLDDASSDKSKKLCEYLEDLKKKLDEILRSSKYAVLILPTHPTAAPFHVQPLSRFPNFGYTAIFNVLQFPATSIPVGINSDGLPLSVQVVALPKHDFLCLSVAEHFENIFGGWTCF